MTRNGVRSSVAEQTEMGRLELAELGWPERQAY